MTSTTTNTADRILMTAVDGSDRVAQAARNAIHQAFNTAPADGPASPITTAMIADPASDLRTSARNADFGD